MKEQLQIVLRKNRRSGDLIQIARKADKKKIIHSYQEGVDPLSDTPLLNKAELFELKWFDQMLKFFLDQTESHATDLERYRLFMPESLYQAMYHLWVRCEENNIDYRPMDSIIKSIINKIKATETKLYEKTGERVNVLKDINFRELVTDTDKDAQDAKTIFSTLIETPKFFEFFNQMAQSKYRKLSNIKENHFKGYAKAHHLPPKWVYACAIDVIAKRINPLSIITEDCLFVLWVKPNLRIGISKDTLLGQLNEWGASHHIIEKTMQLELV
ncbi:TPA: hypothetical protein ACQDQH_002718 [Legionella pneumophila]